MLDIPRNDDIKNDETPLRYSRVYRQHAATFYFRCSHGHLGKYDLPVSTFRGFEGTVKQRLQCTYRHCSFYEWVFLDGWAYHDPDSDVVTPSPDIVWVVDSRDTLVCDHGGSGVTL